MEADTSTSAPDGGKWAWLAVFGCFMGNVIGDGVMYSFGVFVPKLKEHFNCGSGVISTVLAIQMGACFGSGPIASFLTNKLGWCKTTIFGSVVGAAGLMLSAIAPNIYFLYMTAGILIGLGLGIIYLPRLDCITQYFDKKRPLVTGLAICGSGIGTFIFAPLTDWLLFSTDWQTALLILGCICLSNSLFAFLFRPLPSKTDKEREMEVKTPMLVIEEEETVSDSSDDKDNKEKKETLREMLVLLTNWVFMMFAISNFLTSLGYPIPYTFVPDNAIQVGLMPIQGSFLVSLIGISNTVSRIILGIISQKLNRLFLYNSCLVICGVSMALTNYFTPILVAVSGQQCPEFPHSLLLNQTTNSTLPEDGLPAVCNPYIGQLIYAVLYGITSAAYVLLTTLVLADLLGADKFTNAFGLLLLFQGVATLIGPPIVGVLFDAYKSYNPGFILMGIMISLSGVMLYPIPFIKAKLRQRKIEKLKTSPTWATISTSVSDI